MVWMRYFRPLVATLAGPVSSFRAGHGQKHRVVGEIPAKIRGCLFHTIYFLSPL
jgi:hypothetical protein